MNNTSTSRHYGALDGLRVLACLGIIMMHIMTNSMYAITDTFYTTIIPLFTDFVYVFMVLSAFGMCCGYYERMLGRNNGGKPDLHLNTFYRKRFQKVWPFFALLCLLDFIVSPSRDMLYELFADLTMCFGFLPGNGDLSVIGVGWFIGLIFVFYFLFPFYCVLIDNKRRAWLCLLLSLGYSVICANYFKISRTNILYCSSFLFAGGLVYLYKDRLTALVKTSSWTRPLTFGLVVLALGVYCHFRGGVLPALAASSALLLYGVVASKNPSAGIMTGSRLLENPVMHFLSNISLEVYLCHMLVYRVIEKLGLNTRFGNGWGQYLLTLVLVISGAVLFAWLAHRSIEKIENWMMENNRKKLVPAADKAESDNQADTASVLSQADETPESKEPAESEEEKTEPDQPKTEKEGEPHESADGQ